MEPQDIVLALLVAALVVAAVWDTVQLRIPNLVVAAILILFCADAALDWGTRPLWSQLASGALVLAAGMLMYAKGLWGAGDAKLAFASALWFPLGQLPWWILATVLCGGALALLLLALRRAVSAEQAASLPPALRRRGPIPYGVAIAAGSLYAIL